MLGPDRVEGVRDELVDFASQIPDLDTGDDGADEFAPVKTSLEPEDEAEQESDDSGGQR